jgi:signal transduction histidine kinase
LHSTPIHGHSRQLREVILNLIQNAIDAMAATADRPRVINIATSHFGAAAISISVQDTGPGIEPGQLSRNL